MSNKTFSYETSVESASPSLGQAIYNSIRHPINTVFHPINTIKEFSQALLPSEVLENLKKLNAGPDALLNFKKEGQINMEKASSKPAEKVQPQSFDNKSKGGRVKKQEVKQEEKKQEEAPKKEQKKDEKLVEKKEQKKAEKPEDKKQQLSAPFSEMQKSEQISVVKSLSIKYKDELERFSQEAGKHAELLLEAETLRERAIGLSAEARLLEAKKQMDVELALAQEMEYERKRAQAHDLLVQFENERAAVLAEALLHDKESKYAESLIQKHKQGLEKARALSRRTELLLQESLLSERRLEFELSYGNILNEEVMKENSTDLEVTVQAEQMPECHIAPTVFPKKFYAKAHVQEEFAKTEPKRTEDVNIEQYQNFEQSTSESESAYLQDQPAEAVFVL